MHQLENTLTKEIESRGEEAEHGQEVARGMSPLNNDILRNNVKICGFAHPSLLGLVCRHRQKKPHSVLVGRDSQGPECEIVRHLSVKL